jgi:SAM-dependent methyltransferase
MDFDNYYKEKNNVWGLGLNKLLQMVIREIPKNSNILDLGSAQGRDALFLADCSYNVTVVEKSKIACSQIKSAMTDMKKNNIDVVCQDVVDYKIKKDKYSLINIQNILHFVDKNNGLKIIKECKEVLKLNGFIVVVAFTVSDSNFLKNNNKDNTYFEKQELLKMLLDFDIIYYFEGKIFDKGHAGQVDPHFHMVAKVVAKKLGA